MESQEVTRGVHYVFVPEFGLTFLCGCPPDVTKLLMRRGLIRERTENGVTFETGPNAILMSDLATQNGVFCNLAEFPILQMFYRQGMILPNHPQNTGSKPVVVGHSRGLVALGEYLFRGTYGLADKTEIARCGVGEAFAEEIVREKLWFAFGKIRKSEELLEYHALDGESVEVRPGFRIHRKGVNVFTFDTGTQQLTVDLNLGPDDVYETPFRLGYGRVQREYFSVVHIGEGDGWDTNRPCMASLLQFQGKLYLIDAGPNILASLTAMGVSVNEIEGVFQSHAHDDHFAGLPSLARTDRKMKYYSTQLVRASVMKKMAALMSVPEKNFANTFEFHDLRLDEWNDVEGLLVRPVWSPHPVETNVFFFRATWQGGSRSYAHFADIAAFGVLKRMLLEAPDATEYSRQMYERFTQTLLLPTDLKKVDIGGGMIHGAAEDFALDRSK
ncbi:MAG: MBL fold metallo-hydrolase, partial [Spirochaetales bacterium]|nr:MBL fold metallo-hydrolase [Spirochaetales bacterium]